MNSSFREKKKKRNERRARDRRESHCCPPEQLTNVAPTTSREALCCKKVAHVAVSGVSGQPSSESLYITFFFVTSPNPRHFPP